MSEKPTNFSTDEFNYELQADPNNKCKYPANPKDGIKFNNAWKKARDECKEIKKRIW